MTIKFAVIGDPIAHSLSPAMQNAALKELDPEAEYIAAHVKADGLKDFTECARRELKGFNITVPHKGAIIPFLDEISKEARVAESVNTVTVESGRLYGDTTDGYGLEQALAEAFDFHVPNGRIAFIGCGGLVRFARSRRALPSEPDRDDRRIPGRKNPPGIRYHCAHLRSRRSRKDQNLSEKRRCGNSMHQSRTQTGRSGAI